jgi:sulfate transport system permease protein
VLPGRGLSTGITLTYLSLVVLIPFAALLLRASSISPGRFVELVTTPRALHAFALTVGASFTAALVNTVFGVLVAWVLVRYEFFGKSVLDAVVDLPFALPTAVAGIALTALYTPNGWLGRFFEGAGVRAAFSPLGVVIALTFVSLPFVIRTVGPVLADFEREQEEAAATLGASRLVAFRRVILPAILPATITGFSLAFARSLGEYGSVVFISGNLPRKTEVVPFLIMARLEEYDYDGATAIAVVMLGLSFVLLFALGRVETFFRRRGLGDAT